MPLIPNEQVKLLANALDRTSTVCFAAGVATPAASYFSGASRALGPIFLAATCYIWLCVAVGLHLIARRVLKELEE